MPVSAARFVYQFIYNRNESCSFIPSPHLVQGKLKSKVSKTDAVAHKRSALKKSTQETAPENSAVQKPWTATHFFRFCQENDCTALSQHANLDVNTTRANMGLVS